MPDNTTIKYLYPPNFIGTYEKGTKYGPKRLIVKCTNYSDGSGEDEEIKIKRTDHLTVNGNIPSKLIVERVDYVVAGMIITLSYNNMNHDVIGIFGIASGNDSGSLDFTKVGGFVPTTDDSADSLVGGGDIILTTEGATSGDSYDITLTVRLKD